MEPGPPALGVLSLSHWTTRKDPGKGEDSIAQNGVQYIIPVSNMMRKEKMWGLILS